MSETKADYGTDTRIIRVHKNANYFSVSNIPFNDKRLSWEARGLMGYLLSKPDNWNVNMSNLENEGPAKDSKLRRMLSELRLYGYMTRTRIKNLDGSFTWTTNIYEDPTQNPHPSPSYRKSTSVPSTSGKQADIVNTERKSTKFFKDKKTKANINTDEPTPEIVTHQPTASKDPIIVALISGGVFPNAKTLDFLTLWRSVFTEGERKGERIHTDERIIQAIKSHPGKGQEYIDRVLITWQANGYPKTRDELLAAAKNHPPIKTTAATKLDAQQAAMRAWLEKEGVPANG